MKLALVNAERTEATKGAKGLCPNCGSELIAKCGAERVDHWAHKGIRNCDDWWENEKEWHRACKGKFPTEWQEVIHTDEESGEKHIADVKTDSGWVIEFQHSYLKPEERYARGAFYRKLVWVVDGTRRKRDKSQFQAIYEEGTNVLEEFGIKRTQFPDECRLLKEWIGSNAYVFFDFNEVKDTAHSDFWFISPLLPSGAVDLWPFSRDKFIELHNNNNFGESLQNLFSLIKKELYRKELIKNVTGRDIGPNRQLGHERHIERRRGRFRF
jgi:hypothetical protein